MSQNTSILRLFRSATFIALVTLPFVYFACSTTTSPVTIADSQFSATTLTADVAGTAPHTDPTLKNGWGIAYEATTSSLIVASNHGSVVTVYDTLGVPRGISVQVPASDSVAGGSPSGMTSNTSTGEFLIPGVGASSYIMATEDGTISAWGIFLQANPAKRLVDRSATAVFKGLAIMNHKLFVANIKENMVNVYDAQFNSSATFTDYAAPAGYAPFNVAAINGILFVSFTRAKMPDDEGGVDDSSGAGIGYIDTYDGNGVRQSQFAKGGSLNSPWGMIQAPSNFGQFSNAILVGSFGDGTISAFDSTGAYLGQIKDATGAVVKIPGLWGLVAPPNASATGKIYYAAGPNDEADGAVGYIQFKK